MTFLEIAQTVRLLAGIQGSGPASVVGATGIEGIIVQFVVDANIDIQNMRDDFNFMKTTKTITTSLGKRVYTLSDIFTPSAPDLKNYDLYSFRLTDLNGLVHILPVDADEYSFDVKTMNQTTERDKPTLVGINPDLSLELHKSPDNSYDITFSYWRSPQILSANSDIPRIPESFHRLIVYKALEKIGVYLSQPEIYRGYNVETSRMLGQLMRHSLPKKRMFRVPMA
jgi:hypothetical protein